MIKKLHFTILLTFCWISLAFSQDYMPKPLNSYVVTINGVEYTVEEGQDIEIDSTLKKPVVSVKLGAFKKFQADSLSFHYPSDFHYSKEDANGFINITIGGANFTFIYMKTAYPMSMNDLVDEMVALYGAENAYVEDKEMELGNRKLIGKRINITFAGQFMTQDVFEIIGEDFKSRYVVFQDLLDDFGNPSEEAITTLKMIHKSIEY